MSHRRVSLALVPSAPPRSLSPSATSAFKSCPLAFKFAYVDRLPEPPSPAASKGTLVHRALERLLDRPAPERTRAAAHVDLRLARDELAEHPDFCDLELAPEELEVLYRDAELLVEGYFELEDPQQVRPVGLELKLEARVGMVRLRGIIDRLDLDPDGELVVTDYKTGSVPSEYHEAKSLSGVHAYAMLCERVLGRRPARVQLYYLSKPEAIIATPTEQSVSGTARKTEALWTAIVRACERDDFRPNAGPLCGFCTFKPYCPLYGGDPHRAVELRGSEIPDGDLQLPLVAVA